MRIAALRTICLLALFSCTVIGAAASEAADADPRLSQPVTIQCTDVRLHAAIDQLSNQTGVKIRCGTASDDWRIRDIPVEVCANEMPLGKLLRAIADATHLALISSKVEDERVYRISRTRALADELAEYEEQNRQHGYAMAVWEWDCAAALKDVPASVMDRVQGVGQKASFAAASEMISALGPEARDKILGGESIRLSVKDVSPDLKLLIEKYLRVTNEVARGFSERAGYDAKVPSDDDFQKSAVVIRCPPYGDGERPSISVRGEGVICEQTFLGNVNVIANVAQGYVPKPPESPKIPRALESSFPEKVWQTKIRLELPKGKDKDSVTFGDACAAIARATGCSVIAENFQGHKKRNIARQIFQRFETEGPLGNVISADYMLNWTADDKNKVLYCADRIWPMSHKGLVPEKLTDGLKRKLDNEGADFDDVIPLAGLSKWQINEWIDQSAELSKLYGPIAGFDKPLWAFYDSLEPKQKEQARSARGLRLFRNNVSTLAAILAAREPEYKLSTGFETRDKWWEESADTKPVTSIVARLKANETRGPNDQPERRYALEFSGKHGTVPFTVGVQFYRPCPIYSAKREQELRKAGQPAE